MRVVVTGGLGFIGQNLAARLSRLTGVHLTAVDWLSGAAPSEKAGYDRVLNACFADPATLPVYLGADVVVHLAAQTTVQDSVRSPMNTFAENVVKTQYLLEFLRLRVPGAKLIFASTGGAITGDHDGAISESLAPRPLSPYGASKLAVEGMLLAYAGSFGMNTAALRFSNVYGPLSARKGSVIATFCRQALETGQLTVNGDGRQTRDYVHVDDICAAIAEVIWQDARGTFQLGTGTATSILDLVATFRSIDPALRIVHAPALPGEVRHNRADISHAAATFGFSPCIGLANGIHQTLDWFTGQMGRESHKNKTGISA